MDSIINVKLLTFANMTAIGVILVFLAFVAYGLNKIISGAPIGGAS